MAKEAEIQIFLEQTIRRGELHQAIVGKDEIARASAAHNSPDFVPNPNLDYLLRIRSVESAAKVLAALKDVDVVSTASKNVSSDRKERLFPDLLLVSKATGQIIVVEIKRDEQTTREAMTELLAYEQEVRNQMPYISSDQIMFVLVSDSYPVLLSHAAGQSILWQRKNVLALQVDGNVGAFTLTIKLPIGWSSTRLNCVPEHCIQVVELTVKSRCQEDADALDALVMDMTYEIARAGERSGGHGFVLVSHDHQASEADQHDDVYTIGIIDPVKMQQEALAESDCTDAPSPIAAYASSKSGKSWPAYDTVTPLIDAVRTTLSKHGACQVRHAGDLATWRDGDHQGTGVAYRYSPWAMLFWGLPHVYRDMLVYHEGLRRMFGFLRRLPSPQDARIGMFVLDNLTTRALFKEGEFEYETLWRFGKILGSTLAVLRSVLDASKPGVPNPDAALAWLGNEILTGLSEVAFRAQAVADMPNPPILLWGNASKAAEMLANLEQWLAWFREDFLASKDHHRDAFDQGLSLHHLYDSNLGFKIDDANKTALSAVAVKLARDAHQFALDSLDDTDRRRRQRLVRVIERAGLATSRDGIPGVTDAQWRASLPTILEAYDEILPSVQHDLAPANLTGTDWAWMKQEVQRAAAAGCKFVAVHLHAGGQLAVADITGEAGQMIPIDDYDVEVFTLSEESANIRTITRSTWAEVISGAAFEKGKH